MAYVILKICTHTYIYQIGLDMLPALGILHRCEGVTKTVEQHSEGVEERDRMGEWRLCKCDKGGERERKRKYEWYILHQGQTAS